jgi:hypothetical protein
MSKPTEMQGEGNYEAAKRFNEKQSKFAKSGRVGKAAADAAPKSRAEAEDLARAEDIGRSHAKEESASVQKESADEGAPSESTKRKSNHNRGRATDKR